jgi:hypothetical protein
MVKLNEIKHLAKKFKIKTQNQKKNDQTWIQNLTDIESVWYHDSSYFLKCFSLKNILK